MVGHQQCQLNIGKREEQPREQHTVGPRQAQHAAKDAEKIYKRVDGAGKQQCCHDELHTVDARLLHEPLVEMVERIEQKVEQRMAAHVVLGAPARDDGVHLGVVARDMVVLDEHFPQSAMQVMAEQRQELAYRQGVERAQNDDRQCHAGPFAAVDFQGIIQGSGDW